MKVFLPILALLLSVTALAQYNRYDFKQRKTQILPKMQYVPLFDTIPKRQANLTTSKEPRLIGTSKHGKVYALPQDNMPCIMPEISKLTIMPNIQGDSIMQKPIDPGIYSPRKRPSFNKSL
jgi:hypothetical protein